MSSLSALTDIATDVTVHRAASGAPGPVLGIVGSVHGDEPCGASAVRSLSAALRDERIALARGTLILVVGNPAALSQGTRFTRDGTDLNRLFDFRFEEDLPQAEWTSEHHRAHALRPVLEAMEMMLDLHSTSSPTVPFAVINDVPGVAELSRELAIPFVTTGWCDPGSLLDKVTVGLARRLGHPAITVECGQHDGTDTAARAFDCALRFLTATGALSTGGPQPDAARFELEREPVLLEVCDILHRPSEGFRLLRPLAGLDRLRAGEVFAADRIAEMRSREMCRVLMPNPHCAVGDEMLFLAREIPWP